MHRTQLSQRTTFFSIACHWNQPKSIPVSSFPLAFTCSCVFNQFSGECVQQQVLCSCEICMLSDFNQWVHFSFDFVLDSVIDKSIYPLLVSFGAVLASWLVLSTLERGVWDIVLCSWAITVTLTMPLSIQVYKLILPNLMLGSNPAMD